MFGTRKKSSSSELFIYMYSISRKGLEDLLPILINAITSLNGEILKCDQERIT